MEVSLGSCEASSLGRTWIGFLDPGECHRCSKLSFSSANNITVSNEHYYATQWDCRASSTKIPDRQGSGVQGQSTGRGTVNVDVNEIFI